MYITFLDEEHNMPFVASVKPNTTLRQALKSINMNIDIV